MNILHKLYRRLFPKRSWTYSHEGCLRTCSLTGVVEALYQDDWGSWWESYDETLPEPGSYV